MKKRGLEDPKPPFRRDDLPPTPPREEREARKRQAVNVYVNRDILKVAREMKINLSQVLERELDKLTADERAKQFYVENKAFIDWHNELAEKHGTLAEAFYGRDAFDDPSV